MLGITVPDAIAFGVMVLGIVAMLRGSKAGDKAATTVHPSSVVTGAAGAIISNESMERLIAEVHGVATAIRESTHDRDRQHTVRLTDTMERLIERMERKG